MSIGSSIVIGTSDTRNGEPVMSWISQLRVIICTQNAVKLKSPANQNRLYAE